MYNKRLWESSHQASVDSILGANKRRVVAKGTGFYNRDRWTARTLWVSLINSVKRYGNDISRYTIQDAVRHANYSGVTDPHLVVAASPDRIPAWLARASVGGNYHEAWHTRYSCRRDLTVDEVWEPLMERWGLLDDWAPYIGAVLTWGNVIEDIRIERWGCKEYPGSPPKMRDLQDLILKMEAEGREASAHRGVAATNDTLSVVMGTFRDLGLGYTSVTQAATLAGYRERSPEGYALVTEGALAPLLERAIHLDKKDDLGHFWLAMEVVAALVTTGTAPPPPPAPPKGPTGGDSPPPPPPPAEGEEEFLPNQGDDDDEEVEPTEAPPSKLPNVAIYKVGDRALYAGIEVEITYAGLPHPQTGEQEITFAPVVKKEV